MELTREKKSPGRSPDRLTLKKAIPAGPISGNHARFLAIAKFFNVNNDRRLAGLSPLELKDFCGWTGIDEREVEEAPLSKEFREIASATAKSKVQTRFESMAPWWLDSLEKLREEGKDKEFVSGMVQFADMVGFKNIDLSHLTPRNDKSPKEVIAETLACLEECFGEKCKPQLVISRLSEYNPGGGGESDEKTVEAGQPDTGVAVLEGSRPDQPLVAERIAEEGVV